MILRIKQELYDKLVQLVKTSLLTEFDIILNNGPEIGVSGTLSEDEEEALRDELMDLWINNEVKVSGTYIPKLVNGKLLLNASFTNYLSSYGEVEAFMPFIDLFEDLEPLLKKYTSGDFQFEDFSLNINMEGTCENIVNVNSYYLSHFTSENEELDITGDTAIKHFIENYLHNWALEQCDCMENMQVSYSLDIESSRLLSIDEYYKDVCELEITD